jgi:hypothetical protein
MGRRKRVRKEWQEEYACRRLLGAVLVEAVLDALSRNARWQDRTSALGFLRDANVQALCEAHLVLPPDLWRAFAEVADQSVEVDYAVVEGSHGCPAPVAASRPTRRASSSSKRRPAGESHGQAGAPPKAIIATERTFTPEPVARPALPGGLMGLIRRVRQAVGWPAAAGAG